MLEFKIPARTSASPRTSLSSEIDPDYEKDAVLYPHLTTYQIQNAGIIEPKDKAIAFLPICAPRFRLQQSITVMRDGGYIEKLFPGEVVKVLEASPNDAWLIEVGRPSLTNMVGLRLRVWRDYLGERPLEEWRARCLAAMEVQERNNIECCGEGEVKEGSGEKEEEKKEKEKAGRKGDEISRQGWIRCV